MDVYVYKTGDSLAAVGIYDLNVTVAREIYMGSDLGDLAAADQYILFALILGRINLCTFDEFDHYVSLLCGV